MVSQASWKAGEPAYAGQHCRQCAKGVLEERVATYTCNWCGATLYFFNVITAEFLAIGDRIMSASDKIDEARVFVIEQAGEWGAKGYDADNPTLRWTAASGAKVVLVN